MTELRRDLHGSDFSPEELLAALYINNRGFSSVNGYFSAVIVDVHRRTLMGITDRQCVGELYYYVGQDGSLMLTSEFVRLLPFSAKRLNKYALSCFFCLGDIERQDTLIQDIKRISEFYTLHFARRLTIRTDYLATVSAIPVQPRCDRWEVLENLDLLLKRAIANLTTEYGQLCNTLSGGVDSSYLQALLLGQDHTRSFSIAFEAYGKDNVYAADVAQYLGTTHSMLTFTGDDFLRYIERGIKVTGKPYMYQGEAMFLKLYDHIAERFPGTTIVSGQTADAALSSGVPAPIRIALQLSHLPYQLIDLMLGSITDEWRALGGDLNEAQLSSDTIKRIERQSRTCREVARYLGFSHDVFGDTADMANGFAGKKVDKLAKAHMYGGEKRRIPSMLAALAGSAGLRITLPFLDPSLLEYALTIPARLKGRKYIGKKLAERYINRKYVYRPKIDKGIPYRKLFREEEHFVEVLEIIKKAGYYQFDVAEMMAKQEYDLLLRLINFHIWKEHIGGSC